MVKTFAVWTFNCPEGFIMEGVPDPPNATIATTEIKFSKDFSESIFLTNTISQTLKYPFSEIGQMILVTGILKDLNMNELKGWCINVCKDMGWGHISLI